MFDLDAIEKDWLNNSFKLSEEEIIEIYRSENITLNKYYLELEEYRKNTKVGMTAGERLLLEFFGVYHNNNWNNNEATLILNNDMTCKYPNSSDECKWTILGKQITITLTYYMIMNDGNEPIPTISRYNSKLKCEEDIKKYEGVYVLKNPTCEITKHTHKAILGNNGIILNEHLFNKVG